MFLGSSSQTITVPPSLKSDAVGADVLKYIYGPGQTNQEQWVSNFTNVVDSWIPFIPLNELHTRLLDENSHLSAEDVLLLACIKLNADVLPENQPLNKQYLAVKSSFMTIEIYDCFKLRFYFSFMSLDMAFFPPRIQPWGAVSDI
ncbi:fungal-specific transcription factor domain-containing protein [Penicillium waksmanii]|uniref:fungal-specific transcription factor domain-containing protein n=1 Tax=Penicillium waksmanii TaxID=69791 RepID=UPI0025488287|nr:fungal-specific transcription factor domain-containing protein [Penicillium waksmanii]KAJ5965576.1 fungal-specific transcription factor domain-containing protein [Penicillium waksmanii]